MDRRFFLAFAGALAAAGASEAAPTPAQLLGVAGDAWFTEWLDGFYARAMADGWSRSLLDTAFSGLAPDPRVTALDARQPEFARPVSDYIKGAVTEGRVGVGKAKRASVAALGRIEQTY